MSKVKICGLSRTEDVDAVNRALPDYAGFVFAPSSRRVDTGKAALLKGMLDARIEAVGVFVNESIDAIAELYSNKVIDMVQLHGDEDDAYIRTLKSRCGCRVIKAVHVGDTLPDLPGSPDYIMFDTASARRGGMGRTFDWDVVRGYAGLPYFLAGGLTASLVRGAINLLSPYCVDVSSGVETDGKKDAEKIAEFVRVVRSAK